MPTPSRTNSTNSGSDASVTDTDGGADPTGTAPGQHNAGLAVNASLPSLNQIGDPKRLLWLGGLVAVGALGVLEWPVVAAVAVGSYVAEQFAKDDIRQAR